jgi:zinc/manganese transport system ATP-binding protein
LNAVELEGLTMGIGSRTILRDVTLAIGSGEFVGVLGPNGAGKTTLFRALLGLVAPGAGSLRVLGRPAARGAAGIGYMPQARSTPGGMRLSGEAFLAGAIHGERWGMPHLDAGGRADIRRVLDLVGASSLACRPLRTLSGGERQLLLLAQALLGQPRLLLLDEPLLNLDPRRQHAIVALVGRLARNLGITVLFSAHELNPLLGAIDRVLYLGGGHAAIGTVDEVITGPVLSRLYGADIEVVRAAGRIFVMSGGNEVERAHACADGLHA